MWLEDDGEDAAMLPCLPFRGCDVADGFLALAMGVCGAFCDLAVLCGIPSTFFFFLHSEIFAFFRDPMNLPVLLSRTTKYLIPIGKSCKGKKKCAL